MKKNPRRSFLAEVSGKFHRFFLFLPYVYNITLRFIIYASLLHPFPRVSYLFHEESLVRSIRSIKIDEEYIYVTKYTPSIRGANTFTICKH